MDDRSKRQRIDTNQIQKQTTSDGHQPKVEFAKPFTFIEDLEGCTEHLTQCNRTLKSAVNSLRSVTKEFTRQSKFMQVDRSYDLVTEDDIREAQKEVAKEVGPEIEELLQQVDAMLDNMAKEEQDLARKVADQDKLLQLYRQGNHMQQRQDDTAIKEAEAKLQELNERLRSVQLSCKTEERRYSEQKLAFDKLVEENRQLEAELEQSSAENEKNDEQEQKELEAEIARWDEAIAEKEALLASKEAEKARKMEKAKTKKMQTDECNIEPAEAEYLKDYQDQLHIVQSALSKLKKDKDKGYSEDAFKEFYDVTEKVLQALQETPLPAPSPDKTADENNSNVIERCTKQLGSLFKLVLPSYALSKTATKIIELLLTDENNKLAVSELLKIFPLKTINKHHLIKALKILLTANIIEADDLNITLKS